MGLLLGVMTMNIPPALDALMSPLPGLLPAHLGADHRHVLAPRPDHAAGRHPGRPLPLKSNLIICTLFITLGNLVALAFSETWPQRGPDGPGDLRFGHRGGLCGHHED
jgi:hypothetical protein